jgi:hypothetical protein
LYAASLVSNALRLPNWRCEKAESRFQEVVQSPEDRARSKRSAIRVADAAIGSVGAVVVLDEGVALASSVGVGAGDGLTAASSVASGGDFVPAEPDGWSAPAHPATINATLAMTDSGPG